MLDDANQYKDLYVQTSREYLDSLNAQLIALEKNPNDLSNVEGIFRDAHSLKGQSAAMGYDSTGYLCHVIEDIFFEIKTGQKRVDQALATLLFSAFDEITASVDLIQAEGREKNLDEIAQTLKSAAGVNTQGAGKSQRNADGSIPSPEQPPTPSASSASPAPPASTNPPVSSTPSAVAKSRKLDTINVKVEKLDEILHLLESLIIDRMSLGKIAKELNHEKLTDFYNTFGRTLESLRFSILGARAVPLEYVLKHYERAVRDLAAKEHKDLRLEISGGDLELDRTIVERLDEPLIHLVRNAASHGIQDSGTITISCRKERGNAVIRVIDDGQGINWEKVKQQMDVKSDDMNLLKKALFSGISTASEVTEVSGRGVGLQAVKKMVDDLGGSIQVESEKGQGTAFVLTLPLSVAITKVVMVRVGDQKFAIPVHIINRTVQLSSFQIKKAADQEVIVIDEEQVMLLSLSERFRIEPDPNLEKDSEQAVIVEEGKEKIGLVVDSVEELLEIVVKPTPASFENKEYVLGTAVLDDGSAVLILNPASLL